MTENLAHRNEGYALLKGRGVEIGALHQPAPIPPGCSISYCDVCSSQDAAEKFAELEPGSLVHVDFPCDLDQAQPGQLAAGDLDFVIINHVLEHLANPIRAVEILFNAVRVHGLVVLSIPDKEYTFDRGRSLTTFEHLAEEYREGVSEVSDEHYIDFLRHVHPEVFQGPNADSGLSRHVAGARHRRAHAHVWSSQSFIEFLSLAYRLLGIRAEPLFEHTGDKNNLEYFSVWKKLR